MVNATVDYGKAEDFDVEKVLATLTVPEKISLLGGKDFWHTVDIPSKGVPPVRVSDGPNGVRGIQFFNGTPSNCFPCGTGLGSSFDVELAKDIGTQLGAECRAKGAHVILGPTTNIQRSPLGGRGFESFAEDPLLSGMIAASYINGVQSQGVGACIKHYVGNDQEFERFSADSVIPMRALREIYLEPFRLAQKLADPKCYMTCYNRVNGVHVSEDKFLMDDVLRKEWGFKGMIMSDWTGVYSCAESIKAGLDLEMPGPPVFRGAQALRSLHSQKLFEYDIDERVRNVLNLCKDAIASGIPFNAKETFEDTAATRALLRRAAADATVLLKNDKGVLPITNKYKKIAVFGSNARVAITSGGGSASLLSSYTSNPLEAITAAAKEIGSEVEFSMGSASYQYLPAATAQLSHPEGKAGSRAKIEFWIGEAPSADWLSETASIKEVAAPQYVCDTNTAAAFMMDGIPTDIGEGKPWIRYTSNFTPDQSGDWELALGSSNSANLYFDGKLLIDNSSKWEAGEMWFNMGSLERRATVSGLEAGKAYTVELRAAYREDPRGSPFRIAGAVRIGALPVVESAKAITDAVELAKKSDLAICVVGLNEDFETEGYDRKHMELPGTTNELVAAILKANPNTVIVNQTGTPVSMPWVNEASTLVQAFYGGNDVGNGLADILFGKVNPSGKLALSFPKRLADSPSDIGFGIDTDTPGKTFYTESIYVGYRFFEKSDTSVLFPFGHGLSYTTFSYSDIKVSPISAEGDFEVSFSLENTGKVAGREVAQVYIHDKECTVPRPKKELKGFKKVLLQPGEKQTVTIPLSRDALRFFDERRNWWCAEAGEFEVLVGGSSASQPISATTKLGKTLTWLGL